MYTSLKTISAKIVTTPFQGLIDIGLSEASILDKTKISHASIHKHKGRISYESHLLLLELARQNGISNGNESLWNFSLENAISDFGELFSTCINCATAREGISLFLQYRGIIGESDTILLTENTHSSMLTYMNEVITPHSSYEALANFIIIKSIIQFYNPDTPVVMDIYLLGQPSFDKDRCLSIFKGHFFINENINKAIFDKELLDKRSRQYNPLLTPFLLERLNTEFLTNSDYQKQTYCKVKSLVKSAISEHGFDNLTINDISTRMHISRWTLNRKLDREGSNYQAVIREIKKEEAVKYILYESKPIGEISDLLGFTSQTTFTRFFFRNFGVTPSQFRDAALL